MAVELSSSLDHRRRYVHAVDGFEVQCERLSQPSRTAAEVQRAPARCFEPERTSPLQHARDLPLAAQEELVLRPWTPLAVRGESGPERIARGEVAPATAKRFEGPGAQFRVRRPCHGLTRRETRAEGGRIARQDQAIAGGSRSRTKTKCSGFGPEERHATSQLLPPIGDFIRCGRV
jgi:hypothetical protein